MSCSTVSRVLARAGLSRLRELEPADPVQRYEHAAPGDLLHIDVKKLGRIARPSHRVTGNRRDTVEGAGWEYLFVAVDDHARIGFSGVYAEERAATASQFLHNAVAYYHSLGVRVRRVLTDNGGVFRSRDFIAACHRLRIKQRFTRAYRPQTNGKAERFIQSALREWAYAFTYQNSAERTAALDDWIHHYNWHRPHQGIQGVAPMQRLSASRNNLLTLHNLAGPAAGATGRHREPRRRRRQHRGRGGCQVAGRRLRAVPGPGRHDDDQPVRLREDAVRHDEGLRANLAADVAADRDGRQSVRSREEREGVHRRTWWYSPTAAPT